MVILDRSRADDFVDVFQRTIKYRPVANQFSIRQRKWRKSFIARQKQLGASPARGILDAARLSCRRAAEFVVPAGLLDPCAAIRETAAVPGEQAADHSGEQVEQQPEPETVFLRQEL